MGRPGARSAQQIGEVKLGIVALAGKERGNAHTKRFLLASLYKGQFITVAVQIASYRNIGNRTSRRDAADNCTYVIEIGVGRLHKGNNINKDTSYMMN